MPLQLIRDDLLHFKVQAIVNSANPKPNFFPGVDKTIYINAGNELLDARKKIGHMKDTQTEITSGFNLPCDYIIHTISPHWLFTKDREEKLRTCYQNCLNIAKENNITSIAFPLLSSGNNQFPKDIALKIALEEIESFLLKDDMEIYLALYDSKSYSLSKQLFGDIQSYIDDNYVNLDKNRIAYEAMPRNAFYNEKRNVSNREETFFEEYESSPIEKCESISFNAFPDLSFKVESTFQEHLFYLIDSKGLKDVDVYKKANIDKKLFSKIRSNKNYHPKKETVLALCISMQLNLDDTKDLLMKAGYALSNANLQDVIIQYCIERKEYDINKINIVLFDHNLKTLGV